MKVANGIVIQWGESIHADSVNGETISHSSSRYAENQGDHIAWVRPEIDFLNTESIYYAAGYIYDSTYYPTFTTSVLKPIAWIKGYTHQNASKPILGFNTYATAGETFGTNASIAWIAIGKWK